MGNIEKFREILQQYADKGHERFNNALDKYEEGERSDEFYWDGYSDCAESLLKIYDSMQKELQVRKYKCLHDYYPFGEPRSYIAGKIYDVLRDDQGAEWITNDNGHSELFGYLSNHFELVEEPESKLGEIPPKFPLISPKEESGNDVVMQHVKAFMEKESRKEAIEREMESRHDYNTKAKRKEEPESEDLGITTEDKIVEIAEDYTYYGQSDFICKRTMLEKLAQWQKEQLMKKTCEFLYDQLNNGDMECGDIEKFIEKFKNIIEE